MNSKMLILYVLIRLTRILQFHDFTLGNAHLDLFDLSLSKSSPLTVRICGRFRPFHSRITSEVSV